MTLIAMEEAFSLPELDALLRDGMTRGITDPVLAADFAHRVALFRKEFAGKLVDITEYRLPEMDRYGIELQVLSLTTPGIQGLRDTATAVAHARLANDRLADIVARHPGRFRGLAALPLQSPAAAVAELRRAVGELRLSGALVNDHTGGHYLDDERYDPLWAELDLLQVPLYLHPGAPPADAWRVLEGRPELVGPTWSWGAETSAHALRILYSGVFDRYPAARLVLGHMGEGLPFLLSRLDARYGYLASRRLGRAPSRYFGENILITTSGVCSAAALVGAVLAIGAEAILFAVDYPFEPTAEAVRFITTAPLSPADRERITHLNARRLLGI